MKRMEVVRKTIMGIIGQGSELLRTKRGETVVQEGKLFGHKFFKSPMSTYEGIIIHRVVIKGKKDAIKVVDG